MEKNIGNFKRNLQQTFVYQIVAITTLDCKSRFALRKEIEQQFFSNFRLDQTCKWQQQFSIS